MKKTLSIVIFLLVVGCAPAGSLGGEATATPKLDYAAAIQTISVNELRDNCATYLGPLGFPLFTAELLAVDETQNPGTIQANIYPAYEVNGKPSTTVQFSLGNDLPTAYRVIGNKVYLLAGADRVNTTNIVLKQNDGIIGYIAQFEVAFDFKGNHQSIKTIGCTPIKKPH